MSRFCMACMEQYDDELDKCPACGYEEKETEKNALHLEPGEVINGRYIVGNAIGYGGFGVTYIGWDAKLEHKVAIKEYMPSEFSTRSIGTKEVTVYEGKKTEQFNSGMKRFHEEAIRLAKFNSDDGIVRVYDSFKENNTAYIIMELLRGETLASYLEREKKVSYEKAVEIITPIIKSLKPVHNAGIIHRDIAPDNIFVTEDGKVKLIDFGAARFATTSHSRSLSVLIKIGYSPEEQYRSRGDQGPYTDVYALGAVMYRMITGETPPDALERRAYLENRKKDILTPISRLTKGIPENIQNAVYNAMNVRIEDRTRTLDEFLEELTSDGKVKRRKGNIKATDFLTWPLWAKIAIPAGAAALVTSAVLIAAGVIKLPGLSGSVIDIPDGMSRMPSVVNSDLDTAEKRLDEESLIYNISGKEYSAQIPKDLILDQSINGGAVVPNNTVVGLLISGGAESAPVPQLEGLPADEAILLVTEAGFTYSAEYVYSDEIAENGVISQSAEPDTEYEVGKEIVLTISKGRDPEKKYDDVMVRVPDFKGKTYDEALKLAKDKKILILAKEKQYSDKYDKDIIISQSTEPETEIMSGSTVELIVSLGKQVIKVPDVQYKSESEAVSQIGKAGLKASVSYEQSESVMAGLVISQDPKSGAVASSGGTVRITVSKGGSSFSMPDVTGMTEAEAKQTLLGKGLSVNVNYVTSSSSVGRVSRQSISSGTSVYAGTSVDITVNAAEALINVPDVKGMSEADAVSTLKKLGFNADTSNQVNSSTVAAGKVAEQRPESGTSQKKGTLIALSVSKGPAVIPVSSVILSRSGTVELMRSEKIKLTAEVSPSNATNSQITWSTSDSSVAYVDSSGNVEGRSAGSAVITASSADGKKATVVIRVTEVSLELSCSALEMNTSQEYTVSCSSNTGLGNISWSSDDSSVARVVPDGSKARIVAGGTPGETRITATASYNGTTLKSSCTVSVKVAPHIEFSSSYLSLSAGSSADLMASYGGSNIIKVTSGSQTKTINTDDGGRISFTSDDDGIAQVSSSGVVTGVSQGITMIRARWNGVSAECEVKVSAAAPKDLSGDLGSNMKWRIENRTLYIDHTGGLNDEGKMVDYGDDSFPWKKYKDEFDYVKIGDGVSDISAYAFRGCSNIREVELPDTLEIVEKYAFDGCSGIEEIEVPYSVKEIYEYAFNCSGLKRIIFYSSGFGILDSETTIGRNAVIISHDNIECTAYRYAQKYGFKYEPF